MIGNLQGQPAGGGANTALSNLASVAINTTLVSDTDSTDNLGSATIFWANAYVDQYYVSSTFYFIKAGTEGIDFKNTTDDTTFRIQTDTSVNLVKFSALSGGVYAPFIMAATTMQPADDSGYDLGTSAVFWRNTYTDKLFLNSTATLDGATAGEVNVVGTLKFGTHTAIGAETVTGFITMKDSGGVSRKLAVVS